MPGPQVTVRITGDSTQLQGALTGAEDKMKSMGKTLTAMGLMQAGAAFSALGSKITNATTGMVTSFTNIETSWAKVQTMLGATSDATAIFEDEINRLTETMPVTGGKVEILAGLYQTLSAGITDSAEATEVLEASMKLAIGGATDTYTAVDAVTTIINSYGMSASEATRVSDIMFQTYKMGKITIDELAGGIGSVTAIAAQAGVEFEEVSAAIAVLTQGGIQSDKAITGLVATITAFLKPSEDMIEIVQNLGYETPLAMLKTEGLSESLDMLSGSTGGSADQLALLFPNIRALKDVLPLTGEMADDFKDALDAMGTSAGNTEEAFGIMADTTESKMALMNNRMEEAKAKFGEMLVPTQLWVEEMKVGLLETLTEVNPELGKLIGGIIVVGGSTMDAFGPMLEFIGSIMMIKHFSGISGKALLKLGLAAGVGMGIFLLFTDIAWEMKAIIIGLIGVTAAYTIAKWALTAAHISWLAATSAGILGGIAIAAVLGALVLVTSAQADATDAAADMAGDLDDAIGDLGGTIGRATSQIDLSTAAIGIREEATRSLAIATEEATIATEQAIDAETRYDATLTEGITTREEMAEANRKMVETIAGTAMIGEIEKGFRLTMGGMVITVFTPEESDILLAQGWTAMPSMQAGGVTTKMTAAILHPEEMILPLDRAKEFGFGGGGDIHIHKGAIVINSNQSPKEIANLVARESMNEIRRAQSRTFKMR